jgi:DnaK suppressor protein
MERFRKRIERELSAALARLRQLGGAATAEESPGPLGGNAGFDEADLIQASEHRELSLLTRERLVERANKLMAALQRIDTGNYGRCLECGDDIEAGRLKVLPEAETCIRCQERLERGAPTGRAM